MVNRYDEFKTYPELIELLKHIDEKIESSSLPPDQVIWSNKKLCEELEISVRTAAYWRAKKMISYIKIDGLIYYKKSDVLAFLDRYQISSTNKKSRLK